MNDSCEYTVDHMICDDVIIMVVVVVYNGEHLCGALDKASLGSGSKNNIFYVLMRDHGEQV